MSARMAFTLVFAGDSGEKRSERFEFIVQDTVICETGVPNVRMLFGHPTPRSRLLRTSVP
jgi:hypothetical protein